MTTLAEQLREELPPVTLLLGPEGSGKQALARELSRIHAHPADRLWVSWLSIEKAGAIQRVAYVAPVGKCKVIVIVLALATSAALNRLLKLLEEPPETVRFILVATREPPVTIRSRSQVVTFAQPGEDGSAPAKSTVLTAIRAAQSGDRAQLATALKAWEAEDSRMLTCWCQERLSGRWHVFHKSDSAASEKFARALLAGLTANRGARPRLAARTALEAASGVEKLHARTAAGAATC